MRSKLSMLMLVGAAMLFALPAGAKVWSFIDPSLTNHEWGTSQSFSDSTHATTITAYGWGCFNTGSYFNSDSTPDRNCIQGETPGTAIDMYNKYIAGDPTEQGLGIENDYLLHHEISQRDFINLDLTNLGVTDATLMIGSLQTNESFKWCLGTKTTQLGNPCNTITGNGADPISFNFHVDSTHNVVSITGVNQDVLMVQQLTTAPEPPALELFGMVLGAGVIFRRRLLALS